MRAVLKLFVVLATTSLAGLVQGSPITLTTDFSFENFEEFGTAGIPSPFSSIAGTFTLTFDPTVEVVDADVTSISFDNPSVPFSTSGIRFTNTLTTMSGLDTFNLEVYSTDFPVLLGTTDFLLRMAGLQFVGTPAASQFLYSTAGNITFWSSGNGTLSSVVSDPLASVPEPGPFALLAIGLLGLIVRKRETPTAGSTA